MTDLAHHPAIDRFIAGLGSRIRHDETLPRAGLYEVKNDTVVMNWNDHGEVYYSVLLHEHIHWSGHRTRLHRRWGLSEDDIAYGVEELTAIFGAIDLCTHFGLGPQVIQQQLRYAEQFLPRMRQADLMAGAQREAKRAVAYLHRRASSQIHDQPIFRSTAALAAMILTKADARPPQPNQTAAFAHLRARSANSRASW